ncbi:acyl carrier protein [Streptomyces sp. NPDC014983]|uniref:acyl carrier protein n=1 Tax=Streptomyces sp. NPDC014983 TaxID=3364933 RepID=UPI0036FFA10F
MPSRTREQLDLLLRTVVSDVIGTEPDELHGATSLVDDFGVDSLELMEIGSRLETALGLCVPVRDLTAADTLGEAVDLLETRLAEPR